MHMNTYDCIWMHMGAHVCYAFCACVACCSCCAHMRIELRLIQTHISSQIIQINGLSPSEGAGARRITISRIDKKYILKYTRNKNDL